MLPEVENVQHEPLQARNQITITIAHNKRACPRKTAQILINAKIFHIPSALVLHGRNSALLAPIPRRRHIVDIRMGSHHTVRKTGVLGIANENGGHKVGAPELLGGHVRERSDLIKQNEIHRNAC